ncbi:hypothetical protein [Fibrobacter sp. UWH3]|uniref:hypothetical protein n=1 Tax=Fibrobacter sp. UWH3 TaxID=1964353 RepID=UPI0011303282|nr:hypothetical protein [Fibrobacter sp. UWH3]
MRKSRYLTLLFGILAIAGLSDCSREPSVKEDVSLQNNHSRIFAQRESFEDAKAFADSMANTNFNTSDSLADTLTVTVNDTVYLMGILPRNVDKIYRFQWNLTKADGKDTVILGNNATPMAWAYSKPGVYYPLFIAFDGNNSTDTAGTDTKRTYINVIDTKPVLNVPKDTLWTSNKGNIVFPITVSDSFGTIKKIMVDLDASGKEDPKEWKYETRKNNDSLYLTIKNDPKKIDSKGNQKIYVIAIDDDNNETKDSVNLHFNRIPKLEILYPKDGERHDITKPFYFYYEGTDEDNPKDLKYFIYAQNGKNGLPPVKAFDSEDLIAENYMSTKCDFWDQEKERNSITLINNPAKELKGRIYWDMYVTDGYDIVHIESISTGEGTSRPWNFYIGDISSNQGSISGQVHYQGRTSHEGINLELNNGINTFVGVTDTKGNYTVNVDPGNYTILAKSGIGEYTSDSLTKIYVESGAMVTVDSMSLKDTVAPIILVKNYDTLTVRNLRQTVYVRDLGSRVKSVSATHNKQEQTLTCNNTDQGAIYNCEFNLANMEDGLHSFEFTAIDNAGNKRVIKPSFVVDATTLTLDVDGAQKQLISEGKELTFNAKITGAYPAPKSVSWTYIIGKDTVTKTSAVNDDGEAKFVLKYSDITKAEEGVDYIMTVRYTENNVNLSAQVKFGVRGENPAIIFTEPGFTTSVTMHDTIDFKVTAFPGNGSSDLTVSWNCGDSKNLDTKYPCPTASTFTDGQESYNTQGTLAFNKTGSYNVVVTVKDVKNRSVSDTVKVIVIADPPSVKATYSGSDKLKINSSVNVTVDASDKYGYVKQIEWGCSNGTIPFDNKKVFDNTPKSVSDVKITLNMPGSETDKFRCKFKVTDDDDEVGYDSLTFKVLLDPPTVKLSTRQATVKINSVQTINAIANDELGYIAEYSYACSDNLKTVTSNDWEIMSSNKAEVKMPNREGKYYCVVQVKDDDGLTARDTATYTVLLDPPTVKAVLASGYDMVTINDKLPLNAIARDELGTIVKIEWGCGVLSKDNDIGLNIVAGSNGSAEATMPSTKQDKYSCIVQVTDDDGNTARDTIHTKVITAPPTITVKSKEIIVREGFNMALSAVATDDNEGVASDPGEISKREWSCGTPSEIDRNWKTVSAYDTVWKAPAPQVSYYCVARATDNDGNTATDTVKVQFTTEQPLIQVQDEKIYINVGDAFTLSATVNDVWQGIDWFSWECKVIETGKSLEKGGKATLYDYNANGKKMTISKDSSYSEQGKDMYCIVKAQETSTQATFSDTTVVHILKQHPMGVITAPDTAYLWSGDANVDDDAMYFFDPSWGGQNSKQGELGDKDNYVFYWRFSGSDNGYYLGNPDGTLDTNISQFNSAFKRRTAVGSMTIYLDFRDSSTTTPSLSFYSRHRAEEAKHTIYFEKAWQTQGKDTVLNNNASLIVAPAFVIVDDVPIEVYPTSGKSVKASVLSGNSWTSGGTITLTDSIVDIKVTTDGTSLYVGLLDEKGTFFIYSSDKTAKNFTSLGNIASTTSPQLLYNASKQQPVVLYINSSKLNKLAYYSSSKWSTKDIARKTQNNQNVTFREINGVFVNGSLVVTAVDNTSDYTLYSAIYDASYNEKQGTSSVAKNVSKMSLSASGSTFYMAFANRDYNNYGPYVYKGTLNTNSISWNKSDVFGKPIFEGFIAYHLSVVTRNNDVYLAMDDHKADYSQVHVFKLKTVNGKQVWHFYGENQLPYFNAVFQKKNNYYLRGSSPLLAFDGAGKLFLSMLARENGSSKPNKYNGPLVMKYVAENWE